MFKKNELKCILRSLENSISNLESYLDKHKEYSSMAEKKEILNQIEEYRNMSFKVDSIIVKEDIEKILNQIENCDSSRLDIKALNT